MKNIELTAQVYAGLTETPIDYYPQKGLYTAISYAFTDLILLASMLLLALILVRQERDSGLLSLIRSLPGGRLKTAIAKLAAFAASLLVVLAVLYGVNLTYCSASFSLGPMNRTIQSVPALMRCTMQITVGQYLLRFCLQMGWCVCDGAVGHAGRPYCQTRCDRLDRRIGTAFGDVWHPCCDSCYEPFECHKVCFFFFFFSQIW